MSNFAQFSPWQRRNCSGARKRSLAGDLRWQGFRILRQDLSGYPANPDRYEMHMSSESLLIILLVGLIAGWLAGQIVQGTGFGIVGDLIIGIIGAFIGSWLLPQLGIHLGAGIVAAIVNATIGALILLLIIKLVRGGGGWRRSWGRAGGRRFRRRMKWGAFGRSDHGSTAAVGAPVHRRHIGVAQQAVTRRKTAHSGG